MIEKLRQSCVNITFLVVLRSRAYILLIIHSTSMQLYAAEPLNTPVRGVIEIHRFTDLKSH